MALECTDVDKVINEIRLERHWKEGGVVNTEEFLDHIKKRFSDWAKLMTRLSNEKKYGEHKEVIQEILELKTYLDNIFPKNTDTFVIDVFHVWPHKVITEHYFSPQPIYSNDSITSLKKHIKFTVFVANEVIRRYFLESTERYVLKYVLGSSSVDYKLHRQIAYYFTTRPTYRLMKDAVIEDLTRADRLIATISNGLRKTT